MAGPSSKCSDEKLHKALSDLDELVSRCPIREDCKVEDTAKEDTANKEKKKKKKKKKLYRLPPDQIRMFLSYRCPPFPEMKTLARLEEEDKEKYKDSRTLATVSQVCVESYQDKIRATQEKMIHELATKGYVTYEATDDEEDEDDNTATQGARGRGGRRRHRPGVTKQAGAGGIKKLN
ncbi:hypothetical protein ACP70R_007826 [Stipagrostis hirtigluma subsp. patula]